MVDNESLRDTLIDLHNYSAMAIMLMDEKDNSFIPIKTDVTKEVTNDISDSVKNNVKNDIEEDIKFKDNKLTYDDNNNIGYALGC